MALPYLFKFPFLMKIPSTFKSLALSAALLTASDITSAQSVTTTTTTAGTISDFSPDTIIVKSEASPEPVRYRYSKTTTYVDEAGNPVSMETVRSGLPVTVYYSGAGDQRIADRVVVRRLVGAPSVAVAPTRIEERSITTNAAGTISEFGPDAIVLRTEGASAPVRYSASRTTTYVDETGNPVSVDTVRSGLPVTVYYSRDGDRMIANRVVVTRRTVAPEPAGSVIEKRTTTTTTTSEPGRVRNEKD